MKRSRAFSLIELVAVLLVLAVIGGIAVPRYFDMADRARSAADQAALSGMNSALQSAFMSHRVADAPDSSWITSIDGVAATMESGKLPDGWVVQGDQLTDTRGNTYVFESETVLAPARIRTADEPGVTLAGGSGGETPSARTRELIQAMSTTEVLAANLSAEEFAFLTASQLAALTPEQLAGFGADHIARLDASQVLALSYEQFEAVSGFITAGQIPYASPEQVAMLSSVAYAALTPAKLAALTDAQRAERAISVAARALASNAIRTLAVGAIKYLLPTQIAGINSDYAMSLISADRRAAFTAAQVRALNSNAVSISYLTEAQRQQLTTAQMASIRTDDLRYAPVSRLGDIPAATVGAIGSGYAMSLISADRRAAFSEAQVQALNARNVSISYLTEAQRQQLTTAQMASIRTDDLRYAPVSRLGDIPAATVGAIASDYAMSLISADRRAAFSEAQVQALNARNVSISYLTEAQRQQLTTAQMASIRTDDLRYAPVSRLGDIPAATVGAIGSDYAMSLISSDRRAAFSAAQVQAINTSVVSLSYMTESQREQLTVAQVSAIRTNDVRYMPPNRMADVPPATVAAISGSYAWSLVSTPRVQALTQAQIVALSTESYGYIMSRLTDTQRSWR
ncbi:MAG: hypothetical protein JNK58_05585 [Phycisphaerae bacterium]|nr:hypothetical protein [Phycisphaerae bacterium]